ncbi:MAG: sigma-70 family RNA polymerase sigma factor [Oscillospiraceae bacterium]|nr:sigma-70 family RNA polymerase sigma factor [Oscillospiraceae bacterium]
MTDKQFADCLLRMKDGSRQALADIYSEYFRLVYSTALSVTNNTAAAEDVTSEFFVRLWAKFSQGNGTFSAEKGGHKRFLAVCAKNLAVDYIKKLSREELVPNDGGEDDGISDNIKYSEKSPEDEITARSEVSAALEELNESEREIIHLKHYCGYTLKEISEILGIPMGTAAWRCRNAENKLRKNVGEVR